MTVEMLVGLFVLGPVVIGLLFGGVTLVAQLLALLTAPLRAAERRAAAEAAAFDAHWDSRP